MPILRDITFIPLTSPDPREATTLEVGREEVFEAAAQATGIVNENRKKPVARSVGPGRNENSFDTGVWPWCSRPWFSAGAAANILILPGKLKGEAFRYDYNW